MKKKIAIIGAGLTGLSAAEQIGDKAVVTIYEKDPSCGGLCQTRSMNDEIYHDYTGHFLHLHDERKKNKIFDLLSKNKHKLLERQRRSFIYIDKTFVPFPFQAHLYYLPEDIREACFIGFMKALKNRKVSFENFFEWMKGKYGEGITKYFMRPYNEKVWQYPLKDIKSEVVRRFFPNPSPEEIIEGALKDRKLMKGYNATFYYPEKGIQKLVDSLQSELGDNVIKTENKVKWVAVKRNNKKIVTLDDGEEEEYDYVISTAPLKEFVQKIYRPEQVRMQTYAKQLRCTSVLNINLDWKGGPGEKLLKQPYKDTHWIYFPEKKYDFYRVGFLPAVSRAMAPKGYYSCYTEIAYKETKLPNMQKAKTVIAKKVKQQLKDAKIIPNVNIRNGTINRIEYAYVVYDDNWKQARSYLLSRLENKGIFSVGRYGAWEYSSMDQALKWGEYAAKKCLSE